VYGNVQPGLVSGLTVLITVGQYHADHPAGANRLAYDEAHFLARRQAQVWMLVQDLDGGHPEYEVDAGVHVLRYKVPKLHDLDIRRIDAHRAPIARLLSKYLTQADTVHGHAPLQSQAVFQFYPAARKIFSIHSPVTMEMALNWSRKNVIHALFHGVGLRLLGKRELNCIQQADEVTVFSCYSKEMLIQIHGRAAAARIRVIPGWIDADVFETGVTQASARAQLGWCQEMPVFFTLRRLVPRMGLDVLLQAAALLRRRGYKFRLVIAGGGIMRAPLEQLTEELGLCEVVAFLGRVDTSMLPVLYAACDAFVLPSAALECFGLIAIEALAAGRPVLATPIGAIPEILSKVEFRWLAASPNKDDLAALMGEFLSGALPVHSESALRAIVRRDYLSENVMSEVAALIVGASQ